MSLQTSFLPVALVPELIHKRFEEDSLFKTIKQEYNLDIDSGFESLKAVKSSKYEAKLLGIIEGDAVLLLERVTKLKNGKVLEFVKTILRGDKSKFFVELSGNNVNSGK